MQPPKEPSKGNPRSKRIATESTTVAPGRSAKGVTGCVTKQARQPPMEECGARVASDATSPTTMTLESFTAVNESGGRDNTPDTTTHSITYVAPNGVPTVEKILPPLSLEAAADAAHPPEPLSQELFDVPPMSHESPKITSRPARGRSTSRASSVSSMGRERSSSVSRRSIGGATGGMVRETFRLHLVMQGTANDEIVAREDVEVAEGIEFAEIFRSSLVARVVIAEVLQRQLLVREEDNCRAVVRRQALANSEALRLDEERCKAAKAAKSQEVVSGDNKLYDRIVRKRQRLGLEGESAAATKSIAKMDSVAKAGKQANEANIKKMEDDRQRLEDDLRQLLKVDAKKRTKKMEQDIELKKSRIQKLNGMLANHTDREIVEKHRAERAVHMKGVDKDVLTGKKSVVVSMAEKDIDEKRKQHEEELEIALRRALQTDKVTTNATGRVGIRDGTLLKLPSIAHSTDTSVAERPLRPVARSPSTRS